MSGNERHQAIIYAVDVINPVFDHIFIHRTDESAGSNRLTDLLFHVDLAVIVGYEELVSGQREN